jgi:hypothetical protein
VAGLFAKGLKVFYSARVGRISFEYLTGFQLRKGFFTSQNWERTFKAAGI